MQSETLLSQAAAPVEVKVPNWVSHRPNTAFKYVGIGFSEKGKGGNYQMEAKKNALYDLASEIKVNISSNSVLYTVQNNNNFNENFNSLIKLSNTDNIEGYTLVDSYENEKQYWVYYELDKQTYADIKAKKKQQTISKASNLIVASFVDEKNKDFSSSLKKRIQAFGVLTPYLSEEINFDPAQTNGVKNVFDLTNLIQGQLQQITVVAQKTLPVIKPFQSKYNPLVYNLELKNKTTLQNFPFIVASDVDQISLNDKASTNAKGELQVKINTVEPLNMQVDFSLNPDITTLMGSDSIGRAGVTLLQQFVQTSTLKVHAQVSNITIFVGSVENNLGVSTGMNAIESYIKQKFNGQEVNFVDKAADADYVITSFADTKQDISSDILEQNYKTKLAALVVKLELKGKGVVEPLFKTEITDVYGYANKLEAAGINAFNNPKLMAELAEALFFLKRKIVVY
jgi:hypothetical protein